MLCHKHSLLLRLARRAASVRQFAGQPAPTNAFVVPTSAVDELLKSKPELLNKLGEPTFSSLGIGDGFWPSSLPLKLLELLHVDCHAPWWAGALLLGAGVRALMLYPTLLSRRAQADAGELQEMTELSEQFRAAQAVNNVAEMRRLAERLRSDELAPARRRSATMLRQGATALGLNLLIVFVVHLGCVRALYTATALPVASMQAGGLWWLTDLTCADPYGLLPAAVTGLLLLNVRYFYRVAPSNQLLLAAKPLAFTLAPMLFFTFLLNCPGQLLLYFLATGGAALATNLAVDAKFAQRRA